MSHRGVRVALFLTLVMVISTVAFPVAAQTVGSSGAPTDGNTNANHVSDTASTQQTSTPSGSPPYFDMTGGTVDPGDNITIWVSFYNDGTATEKMDVQLSFAEPIDSDGWDIVSFGAPSKGSWFESDRYFSADSVSADSVVEAKFTVQVPADATGGTYTIETSFTSYTKDGARTEATPTATVEVTGSSNQPPTANFTYSPANPTTGTNVAFDASDASDSDGSISSYEWDFDNDGTTDATGETAAHVFQSAGEYNVSLTVTDDAGASSVRTRTIQVQAADSGSGSGSSGGQDTTATGHWPTFQHDNARTGHVANGSGPTSSVSDAWRTPLGAVTFSSPTVHDGTVYVGDDGLTVRAVNATTNTTEWTASVDDTVRSAPAVADGTVYVTTRAGSLYALDAADGTEQWTFTPSGGISHLPAVLSSPVVTDGTVYYGTPAGTLYAIDAGSGTEEWQFQTDGEIHASPAVVDGTVYIGSADGSATMYALDASTGTKQWEKDTGTQSAPGFGSADIDSSPTVDSGTVYFANYRGIMWALNTNDGSTKWTTDMGASIVSSSPAVADGRVIIGTGSGSETGHIRAMDASDGTELWTVQPGDFVISSPAIVGSTAYIGSDDGNVYALDTADGSEVWRYNTSTDSSDFDVTSSPAVVDNTVYVGVMKGFGAGSLLALSGSSTDSGDSGDDEDGGDGQTGDDGGSGTGSTAPFAFGVADGTTTPNSSISVEFNFTNTDSSALSGPAVKVTDYPASWTIAGHDDAGATYSTSSGVPTWLWLSVSAGTSKRPTMTFDVPNGTQTGDYTITAQAIGANGNTINQSGTVTVSESGTKTIDEEIAGDDGMIGIVDIQRAIRLWANNAAVPNTGGKAIGIVKIQQLIQQWANGG